MDNLPDFNTLFRYDKDSGKIYWNINSGRAVIGKEAGTLATGGYVRVLINRKSYAVHHIIWWFEYGTWPEEIDHKNMVKNDNQIYNLREVTRSQNMMNKNLQANNTSGTKGVHYCLSRRMWKVQFRKKGFRNKQHYFATKEEAVKCRHELERAFYGETYRASIPA